MPVYERKVLDLDTKIKCYLPLTAGDSNMDSKAVKSPVNTALGYQLSTCTVLSPFFKGLLKKAFMPALKHSCFVDSWQSALSATTTGL